MSEQKEWLKIYHCPKWIPFNKTYKYSFECGYVYFTRSKVQSEVIVEDKTEFQQKWRERKKNITKTSQIQMINFLE